MKTQITMVLGGLRQQFVTNEDIQPAIDRLKYHAEQHKADLEILDAQYVIDEEATRVLH